MPRVLDPNSAGNRSPGASTTRALRNIDHDYDYPEGLNLRPGFEKHDQLVSRIMQYARDSYDRMSRRHGDWREIDTVLKSYTYLPSLGGTRVKKGENEIGEQKDDIRRIIMPVSHVVLETLLTYFTSAFMQDPIFEYEGSGPEDVLGGELLSHVIQKQVHRNAVELALHTAWRDMFAYGVGYASPVWYEEMGRVVRRRPTGFLDSMRARFLQTGEERVLSDYEVLFEGNRLLNIDPYLALPDPNVSAHEVQEGEFFGWIDEGSLTGWLRQESSPTSDLFNVRYLKDISQGSLTSTLQNRGERNKRKTDPPVQTHPVDIVWMYIDLFPKDWELPGGDMPETWCFGVAADKILIKAERLELAHSKMPVAVGAPDFDGYSASPVSRLMTIEEIQMIIDFLYTSHVENIKRLLNGSIVYDPTLINSFDLEDNRPGKKIRLRKRAWGKGGIKDHAIFQLDVKDGTQQNVEEALFLMEQARGATSTQENLSGQFPARTSRISAQEVQGTRLAGLARLERPARIVSRQFMLPIARMFASNTQQFMSQEVYIKTVGELETRLREDFGMKPRNHRLSVKPFDLLIDYDINVHDGVIPGKVDANIFNDFFQVLAQSPELAQQFDIMRVAKTMFREMGLTNVDQYVRQKPIQVMPDEQVAREAERGNIVPVGGDGAL